VTKRRRDLLSLATLSLAALILGHHLVFLTAYGRAYWTMLEYTGHGPVWVVTVATVLILTAGLIFLGVRRLVSLSRTAGAVHTGELTVRDGGLRALTIHVIRLWGVVFSVSLTLFVVNENLERAANDLPAPGLSVLVSSGGHPSPILLFVIVAAVVSLVAALYRWRREILLARIRAARPTWDRSSHRLVTPPEAPGRRPRSLVGSRLAGRAPPLRALLPA